MPPNPIKHLNLEIERAFPSLTRHFPTNDGNPPFTTLHRLPASRFTDTYHDTASSQLHQQGVYLRRRNGEWQAKFAIGDTTTPLKGGVKKFEEVHGLDRITRCMGLVLDSEEEVAKEGGKEETAQGSAGTGRDFKETAGSVILAQLKTVARFRTTRHRWFVDGEYEIAVDRTCFGHVVGEVEFVGEMGLEGGEMVGLKVGGKGGLVLGGGDGAVHGGRQGVEGEEMVGVAADFAASKVERFMERYAWAFERGEGKGKLTAYFERYGWPEGWEREGGAVVVNEAGGVQYLGWVGVMDYGVCVHRPEGRGKGGGKKGGEVLGKKAAEQQYLGWTGVMDYGFRN
ncbi:hypothetical protein B9Z65_4047 [Elsinoe australis]|uniref:CYTH domain-containing protein n=1 Tax=Elsinoe australis TaxID=40998 RepID=A0A2P7Z1Q0_9PEZI|nr:hypothetical protein B9Z65_4047 [Elsinoe australis]